MALLIMHLDHHNAHATEPSLQLKLHRQLGALPQPHTALTPTFIQAQRIEGNSEDTIYLHQNVELRRNDNVIKADEMVYEVPKDLVNASGQTHLIKPGLVITAPRLSVRASTGAGVIEEPQFFLENSGGIGQAKSAEFNGIDQLKLFSTSYTTCQVPNIEDADWYIQAEELNLDQTQDEGIATNGKVIFKGQQLIKVPSLSFPLRNERKSGFLPPTVSFTTRSGLELTSPYYLNIAPNRDFTFIPRAYANRGLAYGGHFRYIEPEGSGNIRFERMEYDSQRQISRYSLLAQGRQRFGDRWVGSYNINEVSDNNYFVDFSRSLIRASQKNLPRDLALSYFENFYNITTRVTSFQTLQDPAAPITVPYNRVPQILLNASRLDVNGFDYQLMAEAARFSHPTQVDGSRFTLKPSISAPLITPAFSITPKLTIQAVSYQLSNKNGFDLLQDRQLSYSIPMLSLDSKLQLERNTHIAGQSYIQTLEPRIYFLYAPFRDQSQQPVFDTRQADFNYTQIFTENRFVGNDRAGDAKQITIGATTKFLDSTNGLERLRIFTGQRFNLTEQRVALPGSTPSNMSKTDFLLGTDGQINAALAVNSLAQFSADTGLITRGNVTVRYRPGENKVVNTSYRYARDALNQIDLSVQYPLLGRWYGVGRFNYSFRESRQIETVAGIEYDGGCWASRAVAQSFATSSGTKTATVLFQLELNGFSKIGSDPMLLLQRAVPGYYPVNNANNHNTKIYNRDAYLDYQ